MIRSSVRPLLISALLGGVCGASALVLTAAAPAGPGPASWADDLTPISTADWSYDRAAHLIERAGFGATPEEIQRLAALTPRAGRRTARQLRGDRQQPPRALRRVGDLGPGHGSVSAEPRRSGAAGARARRGAWRKGAAGRFAAAAAAGRGQVLLRPAPTASRRSGSASGGPTACSRRRGRSRKSSRCSGTATSRPARTRCATTG